MLLANRLDGSCNRYDNWATYTYLNKEEVRCSVTFAKEDIFASWSAEAQSTLALVRGKIHRECLYERGLSLSRFVALVA